MKSTKQLESHGLGAKVLPLCDVRTRDVATLPFQTEEAEALDLATSDLGRAEALLRVRDAMALVEKAQHDLERACTLLSDLQHGAIAWKRVGALSERAHDLWRWMSYRFLPVHGSHLRLDPMAALTFLRKRKGQTT